MKTSLLVIDEFYPAPQAVRRAAIGLNYETKEFLGHKYTGIANEWSPELIDGYIGAAIGGPIDLKIGYFRLGTVAEIPTTHIHADGDCATHACVWYLSDPPGELVAGTAFYRHKTTGFDAMPSADVVAGLGWDEKSFLSEINKDGNDADKWTQTGLVPQKFNRLVVYETSAFHARYPRNAWGDTPADGRLIWVGFFNKR